jgi:hypothetical protein
MRLPTKVANANFSWLLGQAKMNQSYNADVMAGRPATQLRFEQIRRLPHKEQEFVIRFIDTVLEKAQKV